MMGTVMVWTNKRKKGGNLHCERCYLKLTAEAIIFHSHADEAERGEMYWVHMMGGIVRERGGGREGEKTSGVVGLVISAVVSEVTGMNP